MTPEEHQLIAGLFDRMRGFTLSSKDAEAEALINDQVRGLRDAPYMLVQSVLVQEQALQTAESRIRQLEEQVATLQSEAQSRPSSGSGSFLGGFLGGRSEPEPARGTSVPPIGSRATPRADGSRPEWGGAPTAAPTAPQPAAAGGGFLQSALSTAAGVAGGMLAAGAISSMLGGGQSAQTASAAGATQQPQNAADAGSAQKPEEPVHEASYDDDDDDDGDDDGGWFGGDDGGSFDV